MSMQMTEGESYVLFELAGATYALPSRQIQQLDMVGTPTPVPNAPPFVDGVVSVRGQVLPAVSLRARFGFPRVAYDVRSRLVIVREHARTVGLIVDSAREFATIAPESIKPLPEGIGGTSGRYLRGIAHQGDRLLLIVDVHELLETDEQPRDTVSADAGTFM